jgi:hypothetical protein
MDGQVTVQSAFSAATKEILYSDMDSPRGIATLALFTLCFLDVLTTSAILSNGGFEMNPVMVPVVTMPLLHILLKWCVVAFIAGTAAVSEHMVPRSGMMMLCVIIGWYLIVVGNNTLILVNYFHFL